MIIWIVRKKAACKSFVKRWSRFTKLPRKHGVLLPYWHDFFQTLQFFDFVVFSLVLFLNCAVFYLLSFSVGGFQKFHKSHSFIIQNGSLLQIVKSMFPIDELDWSFEFKNLNALYFWNVSHRLVAIEAIHSSTQKQTLFRLSISKRVSSREPTCSWSQVPFDWG